MKFLTVILIIYLLYYAVNIAYDLLHLKKVENAGSEDYEEFNYVDHNPDDTVQSVTVDDVDEADLADTTEFNKGYVILSDLPNSNEESIDIANAKARYDEEQAIESYDSEPKQTLKNEDSEPQDSQQDETDGTHSPVNEMPTATPEEAFMEYVQNKQKQTPERPIEEANPIGKDSRLSPSYKSICQRDDTFLQVVNPEDPRKYKI